MSSFKNWKDVALPPRGANVQVISNKGKISKLGTKSERKRGLGPLLRVLPVDLYKNGMCPSVCVRCVCVRVK